jgi:hypothetical protein
MPSITDVNLPHLHLLLNHVPTVGAVVALGLLIVAFVRRDERLKLVGLEVLFAIAMLTLPVYMSGVGASQKIRNQPGISDAAIRLHQDVALYGFAWMEFAGFIGWVALWQARRHGRAARGLVPVATALLAMSLLVMARAATIGGDIRHPEIHMAAAPEEGAPSAAVEPPAPIKIDPTQFLAAKISSVMVNSPWAWPASETVHFLGLSLSFGVLLAINLRILGAMKRVPFGEIHRLLPWGMLGFGLNLITGMLFFVGQPRQYIDSAPFYWKIVFLMIAGANFLYLTVFRKAWAGTGGAWTATGTDKAMAYVSMFAWLAALYCGRMLPFIGHAF